MPRVGIVPMSWSSITGMWGATVHLELLDAVNTRRVDPQDLDAVTQVWEEITLEAKQRLDQLSAEAQDAARLAAVRSAEVKDIEDRMPHVRRKLKFH